MNDNELHLYFENLISELRGRGVVCAITSGAARDGGLREQHCVRLECAERSLEKNPIDKFGLDRMIEAARRSTAEFVNPELTQWLPDVRPHFRFLES
jgi:hypothetical protein